MGSMLYGAHQSVAGGLHTAFERGTNDRCAAIQIFTKNSSMWREPTLTDEQVKAFRDAHAAFGGPVITHTSYLINLATDKPDVLKKSVDSLVAEVLRSSQLGIPHVVLHPGAHLGFGEDHGITRVAESLDEVHDRTKGATAKILLENTAGQGTCVGHLFDHLSAILSDRQWTKAGEMEQYRFLIRTGALEEIMGLPEEEQIKAKNLIDPRGLGSMFSALGFSHNFPFPVPAF